MSDHVATSEFRSVDRLIAGSSLGDAEVVVIRQQYAELVALRGLVDDIESMCMDDEAHEECRFKSRHFARNLVTVIEEYRRGTPDTGEGDTE